MPGKFEGNENEALAEKLYEFTLDGQCDREIGSVDELGWYGVLIDEHFKAYWIVDEDSNGFFSYTQYDTLFQLNKAWVEIEAMYEAFDSEDLDEIMA